jgi:hypothetical protein
MEKKLEQGINLKNVFIIAGVGMLGAIIGAGATIHFIIYQLNIKLW